MAESKFNEAKQMAQDATSKKEEWITQPHWQWGQRWKYVKSEWEKSRVCSSDENEINVDEMKNKNFNLKIWSFY